MKKIFAFVLAMCMVCGVLLIPTVAAEDTDGQLITIIEENFEEYEKDVNVGSTLMPSFFVCDYNTIGSGIISVQESSSGNLYLKSHVFTQIYAATPIVGAYEFSLDWYQAQGTVQTGIFIRAPKTTSAYYEADGYPDSSTGHGGLFLYARGSKLGVNVKTYDAGASDTSYLKNNTVEIPLPEGVSLPYTLRVTDSGEEIAVYANDILVCRVVFTNPGQVFDNHASEGKFFGNATLYDAEGNEKGSYVNPLLSSDGSIIGWTTRAADMIVDNVTVKVEAAYRTLLAIAKLPTKVTEKNFDAAKEIAEEARAMYDALPEEKKTLVINYAKLTKAEEAIDAIENATEAPTEEPTEPEEVTNEEVTDPVEIPTEAPTDPSEMPTEAPTDTAEGTEERTEGEPVVTVTDDTLAIWILIAVMIVAVGITAGFVTVKVRK